MSSMKDLRLLFVFTIVFSMLTVTGSIVSPLSAKALTQTSNPPWFPAGPSMDNLRYQVYTDSTSELLALQNGAVDIPDTPLSAANAGPICSSPSFTCTAPVAFTGYFELEFHLANDFWGCQMNFGNSACGKEIRQGIAHGLDKNVFVTTELAGAGVAIDNPVPASVNLVTPNPCGWDSTHVQSGTNCIVGTNGGVAYHLATAAGGSGCSNTPSFPYTPGCGTPDFCAAADHFIVAGFATGKTPTTCVLAGLSSTLTSNPVQFFVRNDDTARFHMGQSYVQFVCALFTGTFSLGCGVSPSTNNLVVYVPGPFSAFPGANPCPGPGFPACFTSIPLTWWVYTGGFSDILTIDQSLYFIYNSRFITVPPSAQPPCSSQSVPTFSPANFMFLCNANYDSLSSQLEFAPCLSSSGDPIKGEVTPTFANCPGTTQLTATSAAYQTQDWFGQNAFTIPVWTSNNQFAYLSNWQRVVVHDGNGFIPPGNTFAEFNAYSPNPAVPSTIRQGYSQSAISLNPFTESASLDFGLTDNIWDSPLRVVPSQPSSAFLDWMTILSSQLPPSQLSYIPPPGTTAAFRFTLRNDIFWQTGQKVTAWDLAFSYIALKATGAPNGFALAPVTGIKVLSQTQVDVLVSAVGPFTKISLGTTAVLPGRFWSSCGASPWDAGANTMSFAGANSALTPCIAPSSSVTSSGVILPNATAVDNTKIQPSYDPLASGTLVGSGPWECTGPSLGGGCSSSQHTSVPAGGTYNLQRYGIGIAPGNSLIDYFRSSGNLALWIWSGDIGVFSQDFLNFAHAALCFGQPIPPPSCNMWTMGIGNPTGSASSPAVIGLIQVAIVQRFVGVSWVAPYDWRTAPPPGIATFPPVLYEGTFTLNPATLVGCNLSYNNGGGYDC
jgi:hypothetical protein